MNSKKQFLDYIGEVKNIISPLEISDNKLSEIQGNIMGAELIVPVVGGFSAGKSTLLNSFLGNEILPTAVTPETALATELRYSDSNYIEAVTASGAVERHQLADFARLKDNAQNFKNLRVYLNNENLKAIQPLVLVDMPGFDAPIENHNQAILNYLERGVFFVFLTSIEDGNITLSMKREIDNLQQIGKGFAFCISKTNLRAPDDVKAVQQKIAEQLEDDFDYTGQIALLDMDGGNNLKNILTAVNPDELFKLLFIDELRENYTGLIQSINVKISTFKSDRKEIEETLSALQNSLQGIEAKKQSAINDVEQRYSRDSVSVINQAVTSAILQQKMRLVDLAINNQGAFERELNDITKNALLSAVQTRFRAISQDLIEEMGNGINAQLATLPDGGLAGIAMDVLANSGADAFGKVANTALKSISKAIMVNVTSTTLKALLGSVFGIVGAVLLFLPEIISLFTKGEKERRQREQVEQAIINNVIPQIQQQLNSVLPDLMNQNITALINQVSEQFEEQLQQKRNEIEAAEAEKAAKAAELESTINELESGKQQLTTAANRYLFA
ncbi:dynamin family protein [Neisseria subflava]|uniref:dynamin family protein n=1 Tax=Neisseria subflava TaxID=28449 RepID=UPI0020B89B1A|nr:dynamin family protein [Neisseria subflava]UTG73529.1 dynamin family protein [Neisseria subflava]